MRRLAWAWVSLMMVAACGDDGVVADGTTTANDTTGPGTTGPGTTGPGTTGPGTTGPGTTSPGSSGTTATGSSGTTDADTTAGSEGTTVGSEGTTAGSEGTTVGSEGTTSTSEGTTGGTAGGMAALDASMTGLQIFQDCMPIVPPDPVGASFTLELTNIGAVDASATVTSATFIDVGGAQVGTIDVTPGAFGPVPVGGSSMTLVTKLADTLMPPNGCGVLVCGQSYTLELALDVDGVEVLASDSALVDCVF